MALEPPQPRKIAITGHKYEITEQDIKREFERFGEILEIIFKVNKETGKSKGFTFIEYRDESSAKDAILTMNHTMLHGRKIYVDYARMHRNDDNFNFNHSPTRVVNNLHRSMPSNYGIEYCNNYFERPRRPFNNDYPPIDYNSLSGRRSHELRSPYSPTLQLLPSNTGSFPPFAYNILSNNQPILHASQHNEDLIHSQTVKNQSDNMHLSPNTHDLEANQYSIPPQTTPVSIGANSESWEQEDGEIPPGPQDRKKYEPLEEGEMSDDKSSHVTPVIVDNPPPLVIDHKVDSSPNNKDSVNLQNMQFDEKTNKLLEIIRMQGSLPPEPNEAQVQWAKGGLRNKGDETESNVQHIATITAEITNVNYDLTSQDQTPPSVPTNLGQELLIGPPPPHIRGLPSELIDTSQYVSPIDAYPSPNVNPLSPNTWGNNRFQSRSEFTHCNASHLYDANFRFNDKSSHQDQLTQRHTTSTWSGDPNFIHSADPAYIIQDWIPCTPPIPEQDHSIQYLRNSTMSGINHMREDMPGSCFLIMLTPL